MIKQLYNTEEDPLIIGRKQFSSRLMLGTGKYQNFQQARESILTSGCEILTVAIQELDLIQHCQLRQKKVLN